jgi:hypothetical protein
MNNSKLILRLSCLARITTFYKSLKIMRPVSKHVRVFILIMNHLAHLLVDVLNTIRKLDLHSNLIC